MALRRRDGIRLMSCVSDPRCPVRSASDRYAIFSCGAITPLPRQPVVTSTMPGLELGVAAEPGRDLGVGQPLGRALGRAVPVEDQRHPPPVAGPPLEVGHRGLGVAAVGRRRRERTRDGVGIAQRGDVPPRDAELAGLGLDVLEIAQ